MKNEWEYGFAKQELNFFEVTNLMFSLKTLIMYKSFPVKMCSSKKQKPAGQIVVHCG